MHKTVDPISSYFSLSYSESRDRFLAAARQADATVTSIKHPLSGPEGEALYMDVACIGPDDAENALVIVAGTHGIEGFCGAGVQTTLLSNPQALALFQDMKVVLVHGHNPHGFAWLRRVNEDNVDLNRNYVDFSEPQDPNEYYLELQNWFGEEIFAINAGEYGETAAVANGPIVSSLDSILPNHRSFALVNEYGTVDFDRVIKAIRADNWLHLKGDLDSGQGRAIKQEMRDCFYCVKDEWRQMIWDRAIWSFERMAEGLRKLPELP